MAVSHGKSTGRWNMNPVSALGPTTCSPSTSMCPAVGGSRPPINLRRVLFPQPLGPKRATTSPVRTVRPTLSRAMTSCSVPSPYTLVTPMA